MTVRSEQLRVETSVEEELRLRSLDATPIPDEDIPLGENETLILGIITESYAFDSGVKRPRIGMTDQMGLLFCQAFDSLRIVRLQALLRDRCGIPFGSIIVVSSIEENLTVREFAAAVERLSGRGAFAALDVRAEKPQMVDE